MKSGRSVLLIADIGGYTDYMSTHRLTLAHAEVNTARMLERMIDAAPGWELVEIEGDAAFLARNVPDGADAAAVEQTLAAAVSMHRAFHLERRYVAANLCPCSGCKQAQRLKLKFVAHVGDVAKQAIRDRTKLVGIDVILVHRLLKNPVDIAEYVLLTDELHRAAAAELPVPAREVAPELEGFGTVRAHFLDVADLERALPPLPDPTWRGRLGATFRAAGEGLPYMLGIKPRRRAVAAPAE